MAQEMWKVKVISGGVLFALVCLLTGAECKRSACFKFGHVCWGGHGKRSGQQVESNENEMNRPQLWKMNLKQLQQHFPITNRMDSKLTYRLPGMYPLHHQLVQRQVPLEYQERKYADDQSDMLIIPTESNEYLIASPVHSYSAILKRSADSQMPSGASTEEPLMTSANGLDSQPGTKAFFRDRKPAKNLMENIAGEKEQAPLVQQRLEPNSIEMTAQQFRANSIPKARFYY